VGNLTPGFGDRHVVVLGLDKRRENFLANWLGQIVFRAVPPSFADSYRLTLDECLGRQTGKRLTSLVKINTQNQRAHQLAFPSLAR
jgi:hypothetical protein